MTFSPFINPAGMLGFYLTSPERVIFFGWKKSISVNPAGTKLGAAATGGIRLLEVVPFKGGMSP